LPCEAHRAWVLQVHWKQHDSTVSAAMLLGTHRQQKQAYSAFNVHIKLSLLRASRASALSSPVLDTRHACC